jgi:hypothetical protein
MMLWNQYHDSLRGDAGVGLNHLATAIGLHGHALAMLGRRAQDRLVALRTLGHMALAADMPRLEPHLADSDPHVSLAAAKAVLTIDAAASLTPVLEAYLERHDWPVPALATLLSQLDQQQCAAVLNALCRSRGSDDQVRLLPLLRVTGSPEIQHALDFLLATADDPGVLAAALAQCRSPASSDRIYELTYHADEQVRHYAVRALSRFVTLEPAPEPARDDDAAPDRRAPAARRGRAQPARAKPRRPAQRLAPAVLLPVADESGDLARLLLLLARDAYPVRQEAARGLVAIPGITRQTVEVLLGRMTDATAADHLRQAWADLMFEQGRFDELGLEPKVERVADPRPSAHALH